MKLPNGNRAVVDDDKLRNYLLNPFHKEGRKHADLYRRLLGITLANGEELRSALITAAREEDALPSKISEYGQKYEIHFQMTGLRGTYTILSVWMIRSDEEIPRLVTAFIE